MQKRAREQGNSVFLDDTFTPWADQWEFLTSVGKMSRAQVEEITQEAERRDRILGVRLPPQEDVDDQPWTAPPSRHHKDPPIVGPLPKTMQVILGNQLYIAKEGLHPGLRNRLLRVAAFQNPEFYKAQAMRLSTFDKPRIIACAEDHPRHIGLPRGCLEEVSRVLGDLGVAAVIRDERCTGTSLDVTFHGELRPEQDAAAHAMLAHETGVLAATTAFGKTVVAAWLIANRGVSTLVVVHRQQLMDQWVERLSAFLDVPAKSIGRIGGGRSRATGLLDVAIIQSLVRKGVVDDRVADYGRLIVDECHHVSAQSFEQVARQAKARFVTGLSATVARKDGHHLDRLDARIAGRIPHVVTLRAGMTKKRWRALAELLASVPARDGRVILATGKYIGEGFDDARLDTLFLTLPVSWRGTIAQYAVRLHRLHDGQRDSRLAC
ncbi:MAG: DEAD/DEAH box helicase family protein [Acidobacteriota bacterium]